QTKIFWIVSSIVIGFLIFFAMFHFAEFYSRLLSAPPFDELDEQKFLTAAVFMGSAVAFLTLVAALFILKYWSHSKGGLYALIALALNELWFVIPKGYPPEFLYLKLIPFLIGLIVVWQCGKQRWKKALMGTLIVAFAYGGIDYMAPHGLPDQADPFSPPPYVDFIQEQEGLFRVAGAGGVLMPNFASAVGFYDVRFISSLSVKTYHDFVNRFLRRYPLPFINTLWFTGLSKRYDGMLSIFVNKFSQEAEKDIQAQLKFYSVLGVKYFVMPSASHLDIKEGGASNFRLVYDEEVRIYENIKVLPRTFVVHERQWAKDYEEAQTLAGHQNFDFRKQAVLEDMIPNAASMAHEGPSDSHSKIVHYGARKVELKVETSQPGLAILTDVYYPGWQAEVNGEPAKIYRVNGLLRGVWLPEGEHQVVFSYWPLSFQIGFALAGISSLICLLLVMVSVFGRKRVVSQV
ncbi:MAG: YfhO family protein, partial [Candidatus Parabeggiatoa sp.]|nr:YfhO family protein [Candidatus Parabeggiatoa sp.]